MYTKQQDLKKTSAIALMALAALLAGSMVYYKERVLFADAPFLFFDIVNYHKFAIQNHRFGEWITQIIPYCGSRAHLPLGLLLFAYAISFNLFYFATGLILHRLRQYALVILLCFYHTLFVTDAYYWLSDEIHQASAWTFLFFGATLYLGNNKKPFAVILPFFLILLFLAVFTHFIMIIPIAFLWVYFIADKNNWPFSRNTTIIFSLLIIALVVLKFVTGNSGYDDEHLAWIKHLSFADAIMAPSKLVVRTFLGWCLTRYWVAPLIFGAGLFALFRARRRLLAVWVLLSWIGYFMLMGLTYPNYTLDTRLFHIETEWQTLAIIIAAPFVFSFIPRLKPSHAQLVMVLIVATRLVYIAASAHSFTWRIKFIGQVEAQMKRKNISKAALVVDDDLRTKYVLEWALPYESLLYSATQGDKPQRVFFFIHKDDVTTIHDIGQPIALYTPWGATPPENLNKDYFFVDTAQPYRVMTCQELFK